MKVPRRRRRVPPHKVRHVAFQALWKPEENISAPRAAYGEHFCATRGLRKPEEKVQRKAQRAKRKPEAETMVVRLDITGYLVHG